jgi:imidazolonepropionase-like amidohydrolase
MKKILFQILLMLSAVMVFAQDDVYPTSEAKGTQLIRNATIHVGNGQVINNGMIKIKDGKIEEVGANVNAPADAVIIDAKGKHVYPGLILSNSTLGLIEMGSGSGRAMNDASEIGDMNVSVRSIVAYNSDSKIINTLRSNGILLANSVPQGGIISGLSSVVQLDAWNWEDAAYSTDNGVHFNMPNLLIRPNPFQQQFGQGNQQNAGDALRNALDRIENVKSFFRQAKGYFGQTNKTETNLKFEAVRGLFEKKQKFFVHCDIVKEMLIAIDFAKEFGFDVVIIGGSESFLIPDLLKQNNIAVILGQQHALPTMADDDVDQPYKAATALQQAGVLYAINDDDPQNRGRNLPFNAGTAATYGITKEEALTAITLSPAKILGIDSRTGSIEAGKDANIVICEGDILDMKSSVVTDAFIQGRKINLTDKHKQLYERYKHKYNLK